MKFSLDEHLTHLPFPANEKWKHGVWDFDVFEKDRIRLVFFAPLGEDFQSAHEEDEFYFIARGSGEIVIGNERFSFSSGDTFFVEKNIEHRFENFTNDFATWAIFF